ncbi:protein phosphatase 1 regulatory subunit 36 isoform X1 [Heterodontus francisci]|uniref:protein phosphatase 1 regulatory subunit 36 isoform X1 n=1 Tax=Heterodontus francisci TaxID=7792 RepID=UPI00355C9E2A
MDVYLSLEQLIAAVPAQWVWKDDTNTLELVSLWTTPEIKDKKSKSKVQTILEPINQNQGFRKSKGDISRHSMAMLRTAISSGKILGNVLEPQKSEGRLSQYVTLEDVKNAAFLLLKQNHSLSISPLFQQMLGTRQLNEFLRTLLNYFAAFLYKYDLASKPSNIVTALEKVEMAEADTKMELAQKLMAQTYSTLLLGLGMAEQHHMACGKVMASSTHKDRKLFECLYSYCAYVTWVTNERKNLDAIESEIGRLLRSDTFNFARKVKSEESSTRISQGEYRRFQPKRPPISRILNQRSPVLKTLLQTPQEKSEYLFKQHQVNPAFSANVADEKTRLITSDSKISDDIGIIGEPLSNFFSKLLIPIESFMEEEDMEEEGDVLLQKSGYSLTTENMSSHHQFTDMSRATTVARDSEYDL